MALTTLVIRSQSLSRSASRLGFNIRNLINSKTRNMKLSIYKKIIAVLLVLSSMVACTEKLDVFDENNPTTESYFKTALELQNGVNAIYSSLRSAQLVGREWFFTHDMRGGECASGGAQLEAPRAELLKQPSP